MPTPTNPKKQMLMPSGPLRRALRAAGHHLDPVVQIGKEGLTGAVAAALDQQLAAHELVKVKVGTESPDDRFEVASRIGELAGGQVAQVLGRTMLVYRKHPRKPRFEPGEAVEPEKPDARKVPRDRAPARGKRAPPRGKRAGGTARKARGPRNMGRR